MSDVQFQFGHNVVQGPDGKAWVKTIIRCGPINVEVELPQEIFETFMNNFISSAQENNAVARRANLGLLMPGGKMPKLPPLNGKGNNG